MKFVPVTVGLSLEQIKELEVAVKETAELDNLTEEQFEAIDNLMELASRVTGEYRKQLNYWR